MLRDRLAATGFQLDDVSACCEVSVGTRYEGGNVCGLMEYLDALFGLFSSLTAPRSFCKLHTIVAQGSAPREPYLTT